jgi:N-acyl-phosphatidylethanolamine-hydrolysing phospholipase D
MKPTTCTFIGHATTLIDAGDAKIITDPHFGSRTALLKRKAPLPFLPSELPEFSCVLLSHTHYDHLNIASYKYISCSVPIIVPEGTEPTIGQYVTNPIIELSHYANYELSDGTEITAVPIKHRASRISALRFTNSNAYIIKRPDTNERIFFCGDSAYGPHFSEIGNLGPIDLAILPIGGYEPRSLLKSFHMTPAEAVQAFEDLGAKHMIPIHHSTFKLSLEPLDAPLQWLENITISRNDLASRIHPLKPGEKFTLESK